MARRRSSRRGNATPAWFLGTLLTGALLVALAMTVGWLPNPWGAAPLITVAAESRSTPVVARVGGQVQPVQTFAAVPPGCCELERTETVRGEDGCWWQVAHWKGAPSTRAPLDCPPRAQAWRGDPAITLETTYKQPSADGCTWLAAEWSDGIVTRVPQTCPAGARPARQALPHEDCYEPRWAPVVGRERIAGAGSIFQNCRVITWYGFPRGGLMGILGTKTPDAIVPDFRRQIDKFEGGGRKPIGAFHLIYAVAQAWPTANGKYLNYMPDEDVQRYLDVAEKEDLLVFIDIQIGHSTVQEEVERVLPWLRNPRVHLALDPEFAMPKGVVPGQQIGRLYAEDINLTQQMLQDLVEAYGLPNKILQVHQFIPEMLPDKQNIQNFRNVDLVIDMDGFGAPEVKKFKYRQFIEAENAEFAGIKLFYIQDKPLITEEELLRLDPVPDLIVYQ